MSKVLIIGSGKVANVTVRQCCAHPDIFTEICLAGRTKTKCDALKKEVVESGIKVITAAFDATNAEKTLLTVKIFRPDLIINLAPPHLNLKIMELCLHARASYLDTSYYYPKGSAKCGLSEQLKLGDKFEKAGLTAIIGCGFNPGVTGLFVEYARQKLMDRIRTVDVIDANAGNNGHPYLMNSQIGKNVRELSCPARFMENGKWVTEEPLSRSISLTFPEVGKIRAFMMDHEVMEHLPAIAADSERLRYFSSYKKPFLDLVQTLGSVGMTSSEPITVSGLSISPLAFLEEVLPRPEDLAANTTGKTGVGCLISGEEDGKSVAHMIYSAADHAKCYEQMKSSANDFMAGIPAAIGATMILDGTFRAPGAFTVEAFDPVEFLRRTEEAGLSMKTVKAPRISEG